MELNSQLSKSLSSSTLIRGAGLLRSSTMSIENDTLMDEMQAELDKLKVPSLQLGMFTVLQSHQGNNKSISPVLMELFGDE